MLSFKQFVLAEAEGNTHMSHLEDLVFDLGVEGTRRAIFFLRDLRDMLSPFEKMGASVSLSMKFDGCIHEDTVLWTNHGDMKISEIIKRPELWDSLYVMGKNLDDKISINKLSKIIDGISTVGEKDWVEIEFEGGSIKLTYDHLVHTTNRGWIEAGKILPNDDITEM